MINVYTGNVADDPIGRQKIGSQRSGVVFDADSCEILAEQVTTPYLSLDVMIRLQSMIRPDTAADTETETSKPSSLR
jgi:hypothetical protein